jgi:tetratricopeptide (TPR) repeat protein
MERGLTETLKLVVTWRERAPAGDMRPGLSALFDSLGAAASPLEAGDIEDAIWQLWTDHRLPAAARAMNDAIAALARRDFVGAENKFNALVAEQSLWAEAWNKRATLFFLMGRDDDSIADIHRTLELEPRHFGAMSGFAQICLRRGERDAAAVVLETALSIHPHLHLARQVFDALTHGPRPPLH